MAKAYLGIDWGTHSSKWIFQDTEHTAIVGPIWNSTVWKFPKSLAIYPAARRFTAEAGSASELKRKLINDPDQAFWEGKRAKIDVSLGEAVVFSLAAILLDAKDTIAKRGIELKAYEEVRVRFSHPNWVSASSVMALQYYRDAAAMATSALGANVAHYREETGILIEISELSKFVADHLKLLSDLPAYPLRYDHAAYVAASQGTSDGIRWEMVFESCAAGFRYLLEGEPLAGDAIEIEAAQKFRKLLVIDIGAGSTDAGYMLRTLATVGKEANAKYALLWLPAAAALERAGNWLTDKLRTHWAQEGKIAGRDEAEAHKISASMKWDDVPYVKDWCEAIADHIAGYMFRVPDYQRLPNQPPLEIILTGGSSVVAPLRPVLIAGIRSALTSRGVSNAKVLDGTTFVAVQGLPSMGALSAVEIAQLAVCLGASDPRLSMLKHYPKL